LCFDSAKQHSRPDIKRELVARLKEEVEMARKMESTIQPDNPDTARALMNASHGLFERPALPGLPHRERPSIGEHTPYGYMPSPSGLNYGVQFGLPAAGIGTDGFEPPGLYGGGFGGGALCML
jgi:hypothetical protein